mmetsp:Transcript_11932/g.25832  ORF Transcript_11932/g.25832 Transcript_11932/m.25832 type:complete len:166 (-) Transcript_11932:117-614(-)
MAHTSSRGLSTVISPPMRRELADVRSMRTATSSQLSPSSISFASLPPNHHTIDRADGEEALRRDDDRDEAAGLMTLRCRRENAGEPRLLNSLRAPTSLAKEDAGVTDATEQIATANNVLQLRMRDRFGIGVSDAVIMVTVPPFSSSEFMCNGPVISLRYLYNMHE